MPEPGAGNLLDQISAGSFWGNDPRVNSQLRQRIALQMMAQGKGKGYPKNAGEGLTAIGDALGEIGMARRLEQADLAQQAIQPPAETGTATIGTAPQAYADPGSDQQLPPQATADAAPPVLPAPVQDQTAGSLPPPPQQSIQPALQSPAPPQQSMQPALQSPALAQGLPTDLPPPPQQPMQTALQQPLDPQVDQVRNNAAAILAGRQGGPPQNPMVAGALPRLLAQGQDPSATPVQEGRGGADQRLALNVTPGDPNAPVVLPRPPTGIQTAPSQPPPIRSAPPPVQTAQAAPQQLYPPGYVPPAPGRPEGAPVIGPGKRELQLQQWLAANQGNPYAAMKVAPELQALQAARATRQTEANELFKAQIVRDTALAAERTKGEMDQAKRISEAAEAQQKLQAGQHTTVDGRLMAPDPTKPLGSKWIDITADMPKQVDGSDEPPQLRKPLTEVQSKGHKFWSEMKLAEMQLKGKEELLAKGLAEEAKGKVPFIGNALQSREYRIAKNAANFSVLADLRPDSGAAIGIIEEAKRYKQLMPIYGDDAAAIKAKREARQVIMDATYGNLGEAQPLARWTHNQMLKRQVNEQTKTNEEMSHIKPPAIGFVAKNKKTGQERVWNGENWLDM